MDLTGNDNMPEDEQNSFVSWVWRGAGPSIYESDYGTVRKAPDLRRHGVTTPLYRVTGAAASVDHPCCFDLQGNAAKDVGRTRRISPSRGP